MDAAEDRTLTDEEATQYEALEAELRSVQRTQEIRSRQAAYEAPNASLAAAVNVGTVKADDTLERAFDSYLRTGQANSDISELRAQSVGTDSAGGYSVPTTLLQKLTERMKAFGGLATVVQEITTTSGEPITWPSLDDTGNAGVIAAEGTAPGSGGADLVMGEKTLGAFKYVAPGASNLPLRVSRELLQDSAFDIEGLIVRKLGERIARKQAVDWVSGAGSTAPSGISTGTTYNGFAGAAPTYAELVTAIHQVDPAYRMSALWCFNDATLALIEQIVDGNGRPLLNDYTAGINASAQNRTLLGYPIVIDQAWSTYTDGGTTKWGVFGDLNAGYIIRRVQDVQLLVDPYTRINEGQVQYSLWARADGVPDDTYAYRVLINQA